MPNSFARCFYELKLQKLFRRRIRKNIPKKLRARIFDEKGRKCSYCPDPWATNLDHVIPVTKGGQNSFENLVPCCGSCNSRKGTKDSVEVRHA